MSRINFVIFSIAASILFSGVILSSAFADTPAKSTNFEKTTIIEFENNGNAQIKTVKMWLGQDSGAFKSFKTERDWTGTKTPQGMLVFSTEKPVSQGESVKFGIKTEVASPGINWKTIDASGNDISIGKAEPNTEQPIEVITPPVTPPPTQPTTKPSSNFDDATFRIIPEKPKNGDNIRIVGDGFPPNRQINFYIDNEIIDDFMTDDSGHLLGKAKIPINKLDRVEFSLADADGNKKTISIRIDYVESQPVSPKEKHITVKEFPEIVQPGQTVHASGTGSPGSTLTITSKDPSGNKISEVAIPVDTQGNWSYDTVIPPSVGIGSRIVEISDGTDTITKTVSITDLSAVDITSSTTQYSPGDKMLFNVTATAGKPLEVVIKDPIGKEIFFDIIPVGDSGFVEFEFATDATSTKGTYVVLATQGSDTDVIRIGLGEPPGESIVGKFDKLNYSTSDKAKLTIQGPADANVSILILDPSDKVKVTDTATLGLDGRKDYEIDLAAYKSGVYSVVLKYQKSQDLAIFTVGLQLGAAGEIKMQTTKQEYQQGNGILVLGSAKPNSLLNLKFSDPTGATIRQKDVFTDKNGKFADSSFRIPADGAQGIWTVRAESGANYADVKISVAGTASNEFTVSVDKTSYKPKDMIKISGVGGGKSQSVVVTVYNSANTKILDLNTFTTSEGIFKLDWIIPIDTPLGDYKLSAKTGSNVAEVTVSIQ
ncbi:biofilm-associated protein [Candidatus Nitrosotenuis sp. DW1]|uniref:biofilm-associated protein n=1 Tax=Candidatus Nitrosotenuis sp. DW1 TaxID=2259672 RepID=UPI0015CC87A2|nr:biofilm-associated protein [Candidatus Nitrosotenuis sp. DW1]QLH09405.1 biofilm-associated protein [Candidatus Nitrosotenuis sp. DW1]